MANSAPSLCFLLIFALFCPGYGFRVDMHHRDSPLSPFYIGKSASIMDMLHRSRIFRQSLVAPVSHTVPVGEYIMEIGIGNPSRKFHLMVDTGSDLVWIQCRKCRNCPKSGKFDPFRSASYKNLTCHTPACQILRNLTQESGHCGRSCKYFYAYADGSSSGGFLSSDTISLSSVSGSDKKIPNFSFGCAQSVAISTSVGADGFAGFARSSISLPSQIGFRKFSYCLVDIQASANKTSPLFLGSAALFEPESHFQTIEMLDYTPNSTLYHVDLQSIRVNDIQINLTTDSFKFDPETGLGGTIFDSGTVALRFYPESVAEAVKGALKDQIELPVVENSLLCYNVSGNEGYRFPGLSLQFGGGADISPPASNYFVATEKDVVCLAVIGHPQLSIIGNLFQQNYRVLYNLHNSVISFMPYQCDAL